MQAVSQIAIAVTIALSTAAVTAAEIPLAQTVEAMERLQINAQQHSGYLAEHQEGASKLPISISDTPQTITVISAAQLRDFALHDINSALQTSATVNVEQVESERIFYTSRGFELTNFQVDGLGLPMYYGHSTGRMDAAMYQRIEVVHGANGINTGIGSPAATVNLVRKKPTSDTRASLSASLRSWHGQRFEGDLSGAFNQSWRGRLVVVNDASEWYLDRYQNSSQLVYAVVDYAPNNNALIRFGHSKQNSETDGNLWGALTLYYGDGTPTNFSSSTNTAADWSRWYVQESRSFLDLEALLNDNWSLRAAYNRVRGKQDSLLFFTYSTDPLVGLDPITGLGLSGYSSDYDFAEQQDSLDVYVIGSFGAWSQSHEVVIGGHYATLDYRNTSFYDFHTGNGFPALPNLNDWSGSTPLPEFTDGPAGSDIQTKQQALYAQTRLSLSADIKLVLGGRYNQYESQGSGYGLDQSRDDSQFIPYIGATYRVTDATTWYASYTETFSAQTLHDRQFRRLPPLTGKNTEIGFKMDLFSAVARLSGAYFRVKQVNLGVSDGIVTHPISNSPEPVYRAVDGVISEGVELELAGELAAGWQGSIAVTAFDIEGDGMIEDYTPENLFRATLTYSPVRLEALTFGISYQWQDAISREQGAVGPGYANAGELIVTEQGAYGRLNLMASYQFTRQLSLSVNGNNVSNKRYLNSLLWAQAYYGVPRNISATLRYHF